MRLAHFQANMLADPHHTSFDLGQSNRHVIKVPLHLRQTVSIGQRPSASLSPAEQGRSAPDAVLRPNQTRFLAFRTSHCVCLPHIAI